MNLIPSKSRCERPLNLRQRRRNDRLFGWVA